jgi:hypothetical protein
LKHGLSGQKAFVTLRRNDEGRTMGLILLVLLLAIILGVLGFWQAINILWIIALVLLAVWLIGFLVRGAEGARWYRW